MTQVALHKRLRSGTADSSRGSEVRRRKPLILASLLLGLGMGPVTPLLHPPGYDRITTIGAGMVALVAATGFDYLRVRHQRNEMIGDWVPAEVRIYRRGP